MSAKAYLGCQLWLEPDDSPERVDDLCRAAAASGLGWVRLFLIWPWIEPNPGRWEFTVFDLAFDAAHRYGLRVKATLTANSGPWHIGTPSMLHSHTGPLAHGQRQPMQTYIRQCVERYARHPALGQWLLWNEPSGIREQTDERLGYWRDWLRAAYQDNIALLNRRWRTGFADFEEVPFPEQVPHPDHRSGIWNSYDLWLDDWQGRAAWLNQQLAWVRDQVRALDVTTPICVNPTALLANQAMGAINLDGMAQQVDVLGASFHPSWHFLFAQRHAFPALIVAGTRLLGALPSAQRVEVTEVQSGSTVTSGSRPNGVSTGELMRYYLAGIAAGAESVTGWLLNTRSHDFEAGDWGLLDNMDATSARSLAMKTLHDRLEATLALTGRWRPAPINAWVALDPSASAVEWIDTRLMPPVAGRLPDDGAHGAALLATRLMAHGRVAAPVRFAELPAQGNPGDVIVLSQVVAWHSDAASKLLTFLASGGTLLIDATSGRKNPEASLHRPWPGGLAGPLGWRATDLETRLEGYPIALHGAPAGRWLLARLRAELAPDVGWWAWPALRFSDDGEPCVWERSYGAGRVIVARGLLGPSLVHDPMSTTVVDYILERALPVMGTVRPVAGHQATVVVPVQVEHGALFALLGPDILERSGRAICLQLPPGTYRDLWNDMDLVRSAAGEFCLVAPDGIGLLWRTAD